MKYIWKIVIAFIIINFIGLYIQYTYISSLHKRFYYKKKNEENYKKLMRQKADKKKDKENIRLRKIFNEDIKIDCKLAYRRAKNWEPYKLNLFKAECEHPVEAKFHNGVYSTYFGEKSRCKCVAFGPNSDVPVITYLWKEIY